MKYLKRLNELIKSHTYIDRTSSPYRDAGDIKLSRFVEYTEQFNQGWELVGMQEVDDDGYEVSDRYIKFKDFKFDYSLDEYTESSMKRAISAALSEIGNASWIENFKFGPNKAYGVILLGKVGLIFDKKIFTPILKYHSGREGSTFWLSATFDRGEQYARTVTVTSPDISNHELLRNGIDLQNKSYYQQFMATNADRQKDGLAPLRTPKTVDERAFSNSFDVVRDTGEKQFFIIYVKGSKYDPIEFARKAGGANIELSAKRLTSGETDASNYKRNYNSRQKSFNLMETDPRLKVFYYYNKQDNKWEPYVLDRVIKTKPNVTYKELEVRKGKGNVRLRLYAGDKLRIAKIDEKDPKNPKIHLFEVEVGRINPKDNKKLDLKQEAIPQKEKVVKQPKLPPIIGEKRPVGRPKKQISQPEVKQPVQAQAQVQA